MKNKRRISIRMVVIIMLVVFLSNCIFLHFWSLTNLGGRHIFELDHNQMKTVAEYLISMENYSDILIENPNGTMTVGIRNEIKITDHKVRSAILFLFSKGYDRIEKKDNTISFERWYDLFERFRGYAFSTDESAELTIEFLTETKKMQKNGWYYYVSDYNEWRSKNTYHGHGA